MLLKMGDGASAETFTTIGGIQPLTITINNEIVDVTDKSSAEFRELLAGAGKQSMQITFNGVFKGTAAETLLRTAAQDKTIDNYQLYFESGDYYDAACAVASLQFAGGETGARTFSGTLESSGSFAYTSA